MILSLDIGLNLGWAIGSESQIKDHGLIKLNSKWGHYAALRLYDIARNFRLKLGVRHLFCEKVGGPHYNSNKSLMGMVGILRIIYADSEIQEFPPSTIKKYWTGSGRADKDHMMKITQMYYPEVQDNNVSDAIAIWHYGMKEVVDVFD